MSVPVSRDQGRQVHYRFEYRVQNILEAAPKKKVSCSTKMFYTQKAAQGTSCFELLHQEYGKLTRNTEKYDLIWIILFTFTVK